MFIYSNVYRSSKNHASIKEKINIELVGTSQWYRPTYGQTRIAELS